MACPHIAKHTFRPPRDSDVVHREECCQCFDSQDGPDGIDVCLTCYNAGCTATAEGRHHALTHFNKNGDRHAVHVNIKRRKRELPPSSRRDSQEPPTKKLAIREEEPEHIKYSFETALKCYACSDGGRDLQGTPGVEKVDNVVAGIMSSMSSAQKSEVKAWEEEIIACDHARSLEQDAATKISATGLAHCVKCELANNLWLCLTCGALGCGRQQYGGTGGNGHGLQHYEETGHPIAVKLGTIEPEGTADIYCYLCNDARVDPHLAKHLGNFGIQVSEQKKTEKSMTELQVEQNLKFDFAMTGEDGKELEPLAGPALTGMRNLGNSCYMASVLQTLLALPAFSTRYLLPYPTHALTCPIDDPTSCVECQMGKIADGLLSGRYAIPRSLNPDEAPSTPAFQLGVRPSDFKSLIGKGHPEFATMRQQDAAEFLGHLVKTLQGSSKRHTLEDVTRTFQFVVEQKIKCDTCGGVRLRSDEEDKLTLIVPAVEKPAAAASADVGMEVDASDDKGKAATEGMNKAAEPAKVEFETVSMASLLDSFVEPRTLDEYKCPRCDKKVSATQTFRFATFPDVLVINAARFRLNNWVEQKLDVPIDVPSTFSLDQYLATGKLDGEEELPEDKPDAPALPDFNASAMATLSGMGFPEVRCQKALLATGNTADAEAAMNWLFQHMEDADIDDPIVAVSASSAAPTADEATVSLICDMGFSPAQARQALRETGGSADRAVDWLFSHPEATGDEAEPSTSSAAAPAKSERPGSSAVPATYKLKAFISHKGPSVHSGHYVAHIDEGEGVGWVLFNDEKVVRAEGGAQSADRLAPQAYLYVYTKV